MRDKKIGLFMLPPLTQGGGAEKYFINLARNLRDLGAKADVITMNEQFYKKFLHLFHIFYNLNFFCKNNLIDGERREVVLKQLGDAKWIEVSRKNLKKILSEYEVIYTKNEIVELFLLKMVGYKKLPPVVIGVHTPIYYPIVNSFITRLHNFLYLGFIYKWLINGAFCFHLSNKYTKELVDRVFKIKSQLIYYPFSVKEILEIAQKNIADIEKEKNKTNMIFVGRLTEQKGIKELACIINKIADIPEVDKKCQINIFGKGNEKNEAIIRELENKHVFVKWHGYVENRLVPSILSKHDLFITTALWETLPFNILEAQAMGLPVIAFDISGPNDIVVNGKTGFLVKNKEEFVEKIKNIIENKYFFDKSEIIKNIDDKFEPKKIYSELLSMLE